MARTVVLGIGGHATALRSHYRLELAIGLTNDDDVLPDDIVHIGIGELKTRKRLYERFWRQIPDMGQQIMRGVIRDPSATLGKNVLINTGAQVDHDCVIGDHSILSPAAVLCGGVHLGPGCQIGPGAILLQGVRLDAGTKIPAGTVVIGSDNLCAPSWFIRGRKITPPPRASDLEKLRDSARERVNSDLQSS